ncbi:MAG TPA: DUF6438 domain-containing protein [Cytophagaceae bacterium]|jgi:hypothetical protein|nr:DUF6438 domain-containing protein [Cytophagaceae bacterium]
MRLALIFLMAACLACKTGKGGRQNFESSMITMEKTACYGKCPIYTITIYGTGKAEYDGKKNVKKLGRYEKQLNSNETIKLFKAFDASNFSDFQSEYDTSVTDVPSTLISFLHRGYKKNIKDRMAAPEELKNLEKMVEVIAESDGWTAVSR